MAKHIQSLTKGIILNEKLDVFREVTSALLDEVKSLSALRTVDVRNGINLYDEVSRFEIYLIERALEHTGGRQRQAARLLNVKSTTLNEKIKRFRISMTRMPDANGAQPIG